MKTTVEISPALLARAAEVRKLVNAGRPALPTTIAQEKATNPFLRADDPALMRAVGMAGAKPAAGVKEGRTRTEHFRG